MLGHPKLVVSSGLTVPCSSDLTVPCFDFEKHNIQGSRYRAGGLGSIMDTIDIYEIVLDNG